MKNTNISGTAKHLQSTNAWVWADQILISIMYTWHADNNIINADSFD